jgi:type II secretory pathway pseudopilin PulG
LLMRVRREKGFGLLETAIAMVVVGAIAVGGIVMYSSSDKSAKASELMEDFQTIHDAIERLYANKAGYDGLSETSLAQSGVLPDNMVVGSAIVPSNRTGMSLIVAASSSCPSRPGCRDVFGLHFWDLDPEVCKRAVTMQPPGRPYQIVIGEAEAGGGTGRTTFTPPYDPNAMVSACESLDTNGRGDIILYYRR